MDKQADANLGRVLKGTYVLEKLVGKGGMGVVYEAVHRRLPRRFAVKLLTRRDGGAEIKERFYREATVASQIQHDNVVEIVDFDETDSGELFMVMELLEGQTLADRLHAHGALSRAEMEAVFAPLSAAVAAAHACGVVHRDLKPANVFIHDKVSGTVVKVLDFGIAKMWDGVSLTGTGTLLGTPCYMAPEQISGKRVDARSDIFALGTILYEMVTGTVAFAGTSIAEVAHRIAYGDRPTLPADHPLAFGLQPILDRCLAIDPDERYARVGDLLAALADALQLEQLRETAAAIRAQSGRFARGSKDGRRAVSQTDALLANAPTMAAADLEQGKRARGGGEWEPAGAVTGPAPGSVETGAANAPAAPLRQTEDDSRGERAGRAELALAGLSTLETLRKKKWGIGLSAAAILAVIVLGIYFSQLSKEGDSGRTAQKVTERVLHIEKMIGQAAAAVLVRFCDPTQYHTLQEKDWRICLSGIKKGLKRGPHEALEAVRLLARTQLRVLDGRVEEAAETAAQLVKLKPRWVTGWVNLAWVHLFHGAYEQGLQAAQKAQKNAQRFARRQRRKTDDNIDVLQQAPLRAQARIRGLMSAALVMKGELSLGYFTAAKSGNRARTDPLLSAARSQAAQALGEMDKAERWAVRALASGARFGPALNRVAEVYMAVGAWRRSERLCRRGLVETPLHWRPLMRRCVALSLAFQGKPKAASEMVSALRGGSLASTLGEHVLPFLRAQVLAAVWEATGSGQWARRAVRLLDAIAAQDEKRLSWSPLGHRIAALRCGLHMALADKKSTRACAVAAAQPDTTAHTLLMAAQDALAQGALRRAVELIRRAAVVAERRGVDRDIVQRYQQEAEQWLVPALQAAAGDPNAAGARKRRLQAFLRRVGRLQPQILDFRLLWPGPQEAAVKGGGRL